MTRKYSASEVAEYVAWRDRNIHGVGNAPGFVIGADGAPLQGNAGGAAVSVKAPSEIREFSLGIDSGTDVASNATVTVSTTLQLPFRGKRLIVDPAIASSFLINNIFVGTDFQGAATTPLTGALFLPESLVPLQLTTGQVGNTISMSVTNRSAGPLRFIAGLIGDVLRA